MPRNKWIDLTVILLLFVGLLLLVYILVTSDSDGRQCIANPLKYAAVKLSEANDAAFSGTGSLNKPNSPTLRFDASGVYVNFVQSQGSYVGEPINYSEVFKDLKVKETNG